MTGLDPDIEEAHNNPQVEFLLENNTGYMAHL